MPVVPVLSGGVIVQTATLIVGCTDLLMLMYHRRGFANSRRDRAVRALRVNFIIRGEYPHILRSFKPRVQVG
ncbi:hypothetical protein BDW22DRAFT_1356423 [Trametopsis cervina]|nr:hypothetical protein BDW22DRAFT_1356423 [Trametopsis cervina]